MQRWKKLYLYLFVYIFVLMFYLQDNEYDIYKKHGEI